MNEWHDGDIESGYQEDKFLPRFVCCKGGGGGGDQTTTTTSTPLAGHKPFIDNVLSGSGEFLGRTREGFQLPDQLVAGMNDVQNQAINQLTGAGTAGTQNIANQSAQALQAQFGAGDPNTNPALAAQLQQVADLGQRNLSENILPSLRSSAVQAGQTGSSRQGIAEGIAARGAQEAITQGQTGLLSSAFGQGLQARQGALGAAGAIGQLQTLPGQIGLQAGGILQGQDQRVLDAERQRTLLERQLPLQELATLSNITSQQTSPFGTRTTTASGGGGGGKGGLSGAIGGGLTGFAAGGPIGAGIGALGGAL